MAKSPDAFRTIREVAEWLDTPAHVLRFWESRFAQLKPVKRAGGRRYYRPTDMELLGGIKQLLHEDGLTIRGVQKLLREQGVRHVAAKSQPLDLAPWPKPVRDEGETDAPREIAKPAADRPHLTLVEEVGSFGDDDPQDAGIAPSDEPSSGEDPRLPARPERTAPIETDGLETDADLPWAIPLACAAPIPILAPLWERRGIPANNSEVALVRARSLLQAMDARD